MIDSRVSFFHQSKRLAASGTRPAEQFLREMEEADFYEETTSVVNLPYRNAHWMRANLASRCSVSKMAAGVHQDRGLSLPMQSMEGLTNVQMAKEDPGQTVFIDS